MSSSKAVFYSITIADAVENKDFQKIYAIATEKSLSSVFFAGNVRKIISEVNQSRKNIFDEDRKKMEGILQRFSLANLNYMISVPSEISIQDLELPAAMQAARTEVIERSKKYLGSSLRISRCRFDYTRAIVQFETSEDEEPLTNESSFCMIFGSEVANVEQTVVLVDLLSSREQLITCSKEADKNYCLETSATILASYRMQDRKNSVSALEFLNYRHYSVSLFKPAGAVLETGHARIPVYCVQENTRFYKAPHRQNCQGEAINY